MREWTYSWQLLSTTDAHMTPMTFSISMDQRLRSVSKIMWLIFQHFGLKLLITPILGVFWAHFPPNDVSHCHNPQKHCHNIKSRRLSHKAWKSVQQFNLGAGLRKKDRTGQDRQKVTTWSVLGNNELHVTILQWCGNILPI